MNSDESSLNRMGVRLPMISDSLYEAKGYCRISPGAELSTLDHTGTIRIEHGRLLR
jgi:hypothetical protein